jgi:hypothetical protein
MPVSKPLLINLRSGTRIKSSGLAAVTLKDSTDREASLKVSWGVGESGNPLQLQGRRWALPEIRARVQQPRLPPFVVLLGSGVGCAVGLVCVQIQTHFHTRVDCPRQIMDGKLCFGRAMIVRADKFVDDNLGAPGRCRPSRTQF